MNQPAVIEIYTEITPNPESIKFVTNRLLAKDASIDCKDAQAAAEVPLAKELFGFQYVKGVFIANNFVTVSKHPGYDWNDVIPQVKAFLRNYIAEGKPVVSENYVFAAPPQSASNGREGEVESRIRELLDTYVKPAVENDGGAIQFKSFHEGVVTLMLHGSCSGCPSSIVTLKAGIEGLLKRMVPEVREVVAEAM
ncbi:MAG TPA: NifU family protein [Chitinophagales bacterium]|nr:NifU family protein [Chitinophagales bacterium]